MYTVKYMREFETGKGERRIVEASVQYTDEDDIIELVNVTADMVNVARQREDELAQVQDQDDAVKKSRERLADLEKVKAEFEAKARVVAGQIIEMKQRLEEYGAKTP